MNLAALSIRGRFDRAGIVLSGLCAVHCLASVVLVSALGLGGEALLNPWIHRFGLVLAIAVGLVSLVSAAMRHGRLDNVRLGVIGLGLMAGALTVDHGLPEALLTIAGVALLAIAHLRNLRLSA